MSGIYLENAKTKKRYDVVGIDKDAGTITLKGPHATFTEPYDKDRLKRMGYDLKRDNDE